MPTLPLEKDGQKRIMRDMWLEGDVEDSLIALAGELGWLPDLAKYSEAMAPASKLKLCSALVNVNVDGDADNGYAGSAAAASGVVGAKTKSSSLQRKMSKHNFWRKMGKHNKAKTTSNKEEQQQQEEASVVIRDVARLISAGMCRKFVFVTGHGCSKSAGEVFASDTAAADLQFCCNLCFQHLYPPIPSFL